MTRVLADRTLGNPAAAHALGRRARTLVEEAREDVADALRVGVHDVVFVSGGTEADNLGVLGLARAGAERGLRHVVTTAMEHAAVRESVATLAASEGVAVTRVPPGPDGVVDPHRLAAAVRPDTAAVALTAADGELGAVQRLTDVLDLLDGAVPAHVDAVQAVATLELPLTRVATAAVSAHKLGGPQGVGVAVLRRDVAVRPTTHGGGQERGVRSGTVPTALVAGCALAVRLAVAERAVHAARMRRLRDDLERRLAVLDGVVVLGPSGDGRLATHCTLGVDGVDPEALLTTLDLAGVAVSAGSACAAGSSAPSPVLSATGTTLDASVRCSLGRTTTEQDVAAAAAAIAEAVPRLRAAGGGWAGLRGSRPDAPEVGSPA